MRQCTCKHTHTYAFLTIEPSFTYKGPAKSVPICTNGKEFDTLSSGSDPIFCVQGLTRCLWQGTDFLISHLTSRLPWVSQIFCCKTDSTVSGPECNICLCTSCINFATAGCPCGTIIWCLFSSGRWANCNLPPTLINHLLRLLSFRRWLLLVSVLRAFNCS